MYSGYLAEAVNALERELKYYRKQNDEQAAVIKQLHRGYALPNEVTYIHPFDLTEILDSLPVSDVCFAFGPVQDAIKVGGVYYKQTPNMPCNSTNIK